MNWRDPATAARNWQACRRYLRRYAIAAALLLAVAAWNVGKLLGYWNGYADGLNATAQRKESNS